MPVHLYTASCLGPGQRAEESLRTGDQGAHGVREEPQFVTARAGDTVVLGCDVSHPLNGQPYVVEWFKFGVPIPFFINFRFYPPHVVPEYAGELHYHTYFVFS
ncbi:protein turtle homolog B isoform X1 [Tachysurus ichikawai]